MTSLYRWENWNPETAAVCWRSHSLWVAELSSSLLRWRMVSVHRARPAHPQMWLGFSQRPLHREIVQCCFRLSLPLFIVLWAYTTSGNEEISLCSVVSDWLFLVFVLTQPPAVPSQPVPTDHQEVHVFWVLATGWCSSPRHEKSCPALGLHFSASDIS